MTSTLNHRTVRLRIGLLLGALAMAAPLVRADDHGPRVPLLPRYQQECGACHVAYPPGLLPAPSWQRIMSGLERHYGSDATLDAADVREIAAWLQAHAGTGRRVQTPPPQDRITESSWFLRKHRADEVPPALWRHAAVRSPANCAACHTRAAEGSYREREIVLPR